MEPSANHVTAVTSHGLLITVRTMKSLKGPLPVHAHFFLRGNANISTVGFSYIVLTVEKSKSKLVITSFNNPTGLLVER